MDEILDSIPSDNVKNSINNEKSDNEGDCELIDYFNYPIYFINEDVEFEVVDYIGTSEEFDNEDKPEFLDVIEIYEIEDQKLDDEVTNTNLTDHVRPRRPRRVKNSHLCLDSNKLIGICSKRSKSRGHKIFSCNRCKKSFKHISNLRRHKLMKHDRNKPYKCDTCKKSFKFSSILNNHRRVHTGERPFKCHNCDKSYKNQVQLKEHLRVHSGEKPYSCEHCGKSFIYRSNFSSHSKNCNFSRVEK